MWQDAENDSLHAKDLSGLGGKADTMMPSARRLLDDTKVNRGMFHPFLCREISNEGYYYGNDAWYTIAVAPFCLRGSSLEDLSIRQRLEKVERATWVESQINVVAKPNDIVRVS